MKRSLRKALWHCVDMSAWILSNFRNPEADPPAKLAGTRLQKPSGYVYRPGAEIDKLTLPSGQMVLPGIGITTDWK